MARALKSVLILLLLCLCSTVRADTNPEWTTPLTPFRIAGNLFYVGSRDLAAYLITTPQGHILINSNLESSPPQIQRSVEQLGFKFSDVRILLISHAHFDHDAGSAAILRQTHARYMVMDDDVAVVESGGKSDFAYGNTPGGTYPPAHVDRVLHDGDEVRLGDAVLNAHKTAGHTRGCTTWTMSVNDAGRTLKAVIVGSWNVNPGFRLAGPNPSYPHIAEDYAHTFSVLRALPCDLFLGAHGGYFNMLEKLARRQGGGPNPLLDAAGYQAAVTEREQAFRAELQRQKVSSGTN